MRRRRALALGTAAIGSFAGCIEDIAKGSEATPTPTPAGTTPHVAGSLNGRPHRLDDDLYLIEESETAWIHAFLDVRRKFDANVRPSADPDVVALRRASREAGAKLFVSLQWNFIGIFEEQVPVHVPEPGSNQAQAIIEYAEKLLRAIEEPVEIVGLGNEPIWETADEDFREPDRRLVPFMHQVKNHLVENYTIGDPRFLVGAFVRLYDEGIRTEYRDVYERLYDLARNDGVDGIDLHVHYKSLQQAERMLAIARSKFPDATITATEFSPIWRYNQHKDDSIAEFEGGKGFAAEYGIDDDMTVTEYFEAAKSDRLSPTEMGDFMEAMPWYNVDFVEDMYGLLQKYDIELGIFGFLVEEDVYNIDWTDEWIPFPINCLFQPALIDTETGAHPHYLDDFKKRA